MNLYIVEDSIHLRELLARLISRGDGVQVVGGAGTAREAIDGIGRLKPDVVLLDLRLEQGNGLDVLKQIKMRGQDPIVMAFTNYAYPQYRERFLANGADYFFDKSAELDLMLQALDTVLHQFEREGGTKRVEPTTAARNVRYS